MDYAEKLKDDRWQIVRKHILQRDGYTCRCCGCSKEELHVHHIEYLDNTEPWDYDGSYLITLCSMCHEIVSRKNDSFKEKFGVMAIQLIVSSSSEFYLLNVRDCLVTINNVLVRGRV